MFLLATAEPNFVPPSGAIMVTGYPPYPDSVWVGNGWAGGTPPTQAAQSPTPQEWLERLSPVTQVAIVTGGLANAGIMLWLLKAAGNPSINVENSETVQGVEAMLAAGLISQAESEVLLAPQPPALSP